MSRFLLVPFALLTLCLGACSFVEDDGDVDRARHRAGGAGSSSTITLAGRAFNPITGASVAGAHVTIFDRRTDIALATTTTAGSNGEYSVTLSAPRRGLNVYIVAEATGFTTTRLYPPGRITDDVAVCPPFAGTVDCLSLALLEPSARAFIASAGGVTIDDSKAGILYIATDCDGQPLEGVTAKLRPRGGDLRYTTGPFPDAMRTSTDPSGRIFGYNLKPGRIRIKTRDAQGKRLANVRVEAKAGESTILSALPRSCR